MKYNEQFINDLISNNAEETPTLEFKSSEALKNNREIAKDVSAMANSAGGIIIYGINERNQKADSIDYVDGNAVLKESIERIINTRIQRKIPGVKVLPIRFNKDFRKSVYVVVIPESEEAPHMVDNKFYRRYNFESVAMEEYEVRNLYFRSQTPKINIKTPEFLISKSGGITRDPKTNKFNCIKGSLSIYLSNPSKVLCRDYKAEIFLPQKIVLPKHISPSHEIHQYLSYIEKESIVYSIPSSSSLFPSEKKAKLIDLPIWIWGTNLDYYLHEKMNIQLFYQGGAVKRTWRFTELIKINDKTLNKNDFRSYTEINFKPEDFKI